MKKGDKVVVVNDESCWNGHAGIVLTDPEVYASREVVWVAMPVPAFTREAFARARADLPQMFRTSELEVFQQG